MTELIAVCPECDEAAVTNMSEGYRCKKCSAHFPEPATRESRGHGLPSSPHSKALWDADPDEVFENLEVEG